MIGDVEKQKIIADIEGDNTLTNYFLGTKYKHSPHSIADIREKYIAQKLEAEKEEEKKRLEQKEADESPARQASPAIFGSGYLRKRAAGLTSCWQGHVADARVV